MATKHRVGDWVALFWGPQKVLAQVVEDRGRLGFRGRRLYRIRLDLAHTEPMFIEIPEEDLEATTEADREAWRTKGSLGIHQTMTYRGDKTDERGFPDPLYHYLIIAKPGTKAGAGVASIMPLSTARAEGMGREPSHRIVAETGGPEAALAGAEQYLDAQHEHEGLKKIVGEKNG